MLAQVIIYGGLAGFATILGILLILYKRDLAKKYSVYLVSFAAGVLLGASFFDLIPEAIEHNPQSLMLVLGGIMIFYFLEHFIVVHICKEEDCKKHRFGIMTIVGLGLHSLIDGVAIGVGFGISSSLGLITALAVISHEIPEGIIASSLLLSSNFERKKGILYSTLVAVATPIGAILTFFFVGSFSESVLGMLLAMTAGSFIYIAAADLIPETHEKSSRKAGIMILVGIAFLYFVSRFFGH